MLLAEAIASRLEDSTAFEKCIKTCLIAQQPNGAVRTSTHQAETVSYEQPCVFNYIKACGRNLSKTVMN